MSYHSNPTKRIDSPVTSRCNSPRKPINNRRRSVADEAMMTQQYIQANIEELTKLWDEVHMSEENRVARLSTAYDHIRKLVDDMVEAEQEMVEGVKKDIDEGTEKIQQMRKEMKMDDWTPRHPFPSIALLRAVEKEEKHLRESYEEHVQEQDRVLGRVEVLCFRLGKFAVDLLPETKQLMSVEELARMKQEVSTMEHELNERVEQALTLQADIRNWSKNLGKAFGPSDEVTLTVIINEDIDNDDFAVTDSVMEQLNQFWTELSAMHKSWIDGVDIEWVIRYSTLEELWDKCHIAEGHRQFAPRFDPCRHNENDIEAMDAEISRLKSKYAQREPVYNLMNEWKNAWKEKLAMEEKKKDASYYQSRERGHNLMKDVQFERHLNEVQLPKLRRNIGGAYKAYKESNADDTILIEGYEPMAYIEWTENEYKLTREMERNAKKTAAKEAKTPTRGLLTPSRSLKSLPRSPSTLSLKTPAKQARIVREPPQVSIITPVRADEGGPRTSSPKEPAPSTPRGIRSPMKKRNL